MTRRKRTEKIFMMEEAGGKQQILLDRNIVVVFSVMLSREHHKCAGCWLPAVKLKSHLIFGKLTKTD